jgi:transposase-like protein
MPYPTKNKRKKYSSEFKFKLALEALQKNNLSQVARQYGLGANVISRWKSCLLEQGSQIFDSAPNQVIESLNKKVEKLEQMVGKKEVELNLVKNFSEFYESPNGP